MKQEPGIDTTNVIVKADLKPRPSKQLETPSLTLLLPGRNKRTYKNRSGEKQKVSVDEEPEVIKEVDSWRFCSSTLRLL